MATAVMESKPVLAASQMVVCGECRHHVPCATSPSFWCKCAAGESYQRDVTPSQAACKDFAAWPEGSAAPDLLLAIGF